MGMQSNSQNSGIGSVLGGGLGGLLGGMFGPKNKGSSDASSGTKDGVATPQYSERQQFFQKISDAMKRASAFQNMGNGASVSAPQGSWSSGGFSMPGDMSTTINKFNPAMSGIVSSLQKSGLASPDAPQQPMPAAPAVGSGPNGALTPQQLMQFLATIRGGAPAPVMPGMPMQ